MNKKRKKGRYVNRLVSVICLLGLITNITACGTEKDNDDATSQNFSISFS